MNTFSAKKRTDKRLLIAVVIILIILAASVISIFYMKTKNSSCNIAIIYVDGKKYMELNLEKTEDCIIEIENANGNHNFIEVKNHDIRMNSSDCQNQLCVKQGFAGHSLVPIVCLPNNVVIKLTSNSINQDTESKYYDIISY